MDDFIHYKINIKVEFQSEILEIETLHIEDANKLIAGLKENNFDRNFIVEFLEVMSGTPKRKIESFGKKTKKEKPTINLREFLVKNSNLW